MSCVLELISVCHTGPILPANEVSCWSKVTGPVANGLILKDVSFELHSGEVMAVLESKGSGKKALIDIIGHRMAAHDPKHNRLFLREKEYS